MINDWKQRVQLFFARLRIDRPSLPIRPHFRTTFFILWLTALLGLLYGRLFARGGGESISLLLSSIGAVGAVFIILLENPGYRLKQLFLQVITLILIMALIVVLVITYSLVVVLPNVSVSIEVAWIIAASLLAIVALRSLFTAFLAPLLQHKAYPGMFTAPFFLGLLITNYIVWNWSTIISFLK